MVLSGLRVLVLKICRRLPDVTTKLSDGIVVRGLRGACGKEMCVIGFDCGDGTSCCDRNDFQYRWSAVKGAGPDASRRGCSGCTSAAMVVEVPARRKEWSKRRG